MALSYSQLQLYRRCPRQYEFAVVKKLKSPISPGESFGASAHNTLRKWGELEMRGPRSAASDQLVLFAHERADHPALTAEHLLALWHQSFIVEGFETRLEADFARKRGETLLMRFFAWWQREPRHVLAVEKGFSLPMDGTQMSGRLDRVEKLENGVHIIDFKTSAPRPQQEVDADLQLSVYALAAKELFREPCTRLTLLFLGEEEVQEITTERSDRQLQDAQKQIAAIVERLGQKDFHPTPTREKCRSCPYRGICDARAV